MGYSGDSILDLVDHMENESKLTGRRLAEACGDRFQHNIEQNTPVDTMLLRDSYEQTDVDYKFEPRLNAYVWTGEVFTEVTYAEYVERGTGLWGPHAAKYKIEPKIPGGVLAFHPYARTAKGGVILDLQGGVTKAGKPIFVRYVMHPGSPGAAMFRIGAIMTEAEVELWSRRPLQIWERAVHGRPGAMVSAARG